MTTEKIINEKFLFPHPRNRKDYGEITDLAGSIKANGLMQNLVVVPYDPSAHQGLTVADPSNSYVVVIGNRRLAACKSIGMTEIPCCIADYSPFMQITTMMCENLLRKELTIVEQADAFSVLKNEAGLSAEEIADRTGLSVPSVYNRLTIADMDRGILTAAQNSGATMVQCIQLSHLNDHIDIQRSLLSRVSNRQAFKSCVEAELDKIKTQKVADEVKQKLSSFASFRIQGLSDCKFIASYNCADATFSADDVPVPSDTGSVAYYFCSLGSSFNLYRELTQEEQDTIDKEKMEEENAKMQLDAEYNALVSASSGLADRRKAFVANLNSSTAKRILNIAVAECTRLSFEISRYSLWGFASRIDYDLLSGLTKLTPIKDSASGKSIALDGWEDYSTRSPELATVFFSYAFLESLVSASDSLITHSWGVQAREPMRNWNYTGVYNSLYRLMDAMGYIPTEEESLIIADKHPLLHHKQTVRA